MAGIVKSNTYIYILSRLDLYVMTSSQLILPYGPPTQSLKHFIIDH